MKSEMRKNEVLQDRYVIRGRAGQGRMSSVYLATDAAARDSQVAVKILDTSHPDDIKRELFKRETDALKVLRHENIIPLRDSGWDDERNAFFLILDYAPHSLDQYLGKQPSPVVANLDRYRVMRELADGLAHAHSEGVVHRDIKPSNVLLNANGRPLLADFGISKLIDQLTVGETLAGYWSNGYASPEQRMGEL